MKITAATYKDGCLCLEMPPADARPFVYGFKSGEYEITRAKKKRSHDANSFAWSLLSKIAEATKVPLNDVYKRAVKDVGGNSEAMCVKTSAVEHMEKLWTDRGLGWQMETAPSKISGCTTVIAYYGSSAFDTREMSRFIDQLIQDCESLGIETKPQEYIDSLLEEWK